MRYLRGTVHLLRLGLLAMTPACTRDEPPLAAKPNGAATLEAKIGPFVLSPGLEKTQCVVFRLNNPVGAFIRGFRAELEEGSHHMTLYQSVATTEQREPVDCVGFDTVGSGDRPIFIAERSRTALAFPRDEHGTPIGYKIEPNQMVRIELHYLNTTSKPLSIGSRTFIDTVPISSDVINSDIAFYNTFDIKIPPNSSYKTSVKFVASPPETRTFALTTHQHRLGTRMRVWHANDETDTSGKPVADCSDWANPPLEIFNPPLSFGDGGKRGLAYQCEWNNPTPREVTFGESVTDEMCVFWQYYYPGRGFQKISRP